MALLEIKGLKTHFKTDDGWLHAVDGVDMAIEAGETLGVVGESGCGKSVTAKTVMKLIDMPPGRIVAGQVLWKGRDLVPLSADEMRKIRAKEIAIIFQEPMTSLNPLHSIERQVGEVLRLHGRAPTSRERRERVVELLSRVGIPDPATLPLPAHVVDALADAPLIAIGGFANQRDEFDHGDELLCLDRTDFSLRIDHELEIETADPTTTAATWSRHLEQWNIAYAPQPLTKFARLLALLPA